MLKENSVYGRCKTSMEQWCFFVASGLLMAWAPAYIYTSPMFDLGLLESFPQFVVVGSGCGGLLAWAYSSVSQQRRIQLLGAKPNSGLSAKDATSKKDREEAQLQLEKKTADVCVAYALMVVNGSFLLLWLLSAFYIIPKVSENSLSSSLNHLIAVTAPSLLLAFKAVAFF